MTYFKGRNYIKVSEPTIYTKPHNV